MVIREGGVKWKKNGAAGKEARGWMSNGRRSEEEWETDRKAKTQGNWQEIG